MSMKSRRAEAMLIKAICKGEVGNAKRLIDAGADVEVLNERGWPALYLAAFHGHGDIVAALLRAGANPNTREPEGQTALIAATRATVTRLLLEAGVDANAADDKGLTALDCAITAADAEQVRLLLSHGARVPSEMSTPAYWSMFAQRTEPVRRAIFAHLTAGRIEEAMGESTQEQSPPRRAEASPL